VLQTLKQHPTLYVIPIIIFTSTAQPHEVHQCYALGTKAFIWRPQSQKHRTRRTLERKAKR
jgi:CheY-like chemotaxis protein